MSDSSLLGRSDALFLDLDGCVFEGARVIPGAAETIEHARADGLSVTYVTNNASRTPVEVATHLSGLGIETAPDDIVTSPQAAAELLRKFCSEGDPVLVVGAQSLATEVENAGFRPVRSADDGPTAVVQGFSRDIGWPELAEGTYAVRAGARWIATNVDTTLPTERGPAPGNGALVAALRVATNTEPLVAGKPEPALFETAVARTGAERALAVGDRLDTDIAGANRAGLASVLVLTGVSTGLDALYAVPEERPSHVVARLDELWGNVGEAVVDDGKEIRSSCRDGAARLSGDDLVVVSDPAEIDSLRAALALAWHVNPDGPFTGKTLDEHGHEISILGPTRQAGSTDQ